VLVRLQCLLGWHGGPRVLLGLAVFFSGLAYVPARIWLSRSPEGLAATLTYASTFLLGALTICWTLIAFLELAGLVLRWTAGIHLWQSPAVVRHWIAGGLGGLTILLAVIGVVVAHSAPGVSRVVLSVPGGEARRLAVISDCHLGATAPSDQWRRTVSVLADLKPDAVLIAGDLLDDPSPRALTQIEEFRTALPEVPVFIITGNHDFYSGLNEFADFCRLHEFQLLRQEAKPFGSGLTIAGIDDAHLIDPAQAVEQLLPSLEGAVILLSHRPAAAEFLRNRPDTLVVSGHTHGGQTLPLVFLVSLANGWFRAGYYEVGQAVLYVSRGTGVWGPPMRLLANPELVLIETVPGPAFNVSIPTGESTHGG